MDKIQKDLNVSSIKNLEFKARWAQLGIKLKRKDFIPIVSDILASTGRILYITPLYTVLV